MIPILKQNINGFLTINPTGGAIRIDKAGYGLYGASRGPGKKHYALDFLCIPQQPVWMPVTGTIKRIAYPYSDTNYYEGVYIHGLQMSLKMFYFNPICNLIGSTVWAGRIIGYAQDVTLRYPNDPDMLPHVHTQITDIDPAILFNTDGLCLDGDNNDQLDVLEGIKPWLRK